MSSQFQRRFRTETNNNMTATLEIYTQDEELLISIDHLVKFEYIREGSNADDFYQLSRLHTEYLNFVVGDLNPEEQLTLSTLLNHDNPVRFVVILEDRRRIEFKNFNLNYVSIESSMNGFLTMNLGFISHRRSTQNVKKIIKKSNKMKWSKVGF